ncbi:MAG: glycine--tRNA ligase subunit beta [Rubrivivax sp.]|jgi:glycyl-tRNA synthetase beta chain|nr:glycine--tRNA ligase subunit beta [Rubrivivax sp.]
MSTTRNLLVELLAEELPPKALKKLGEAFGASLLAGLRAQGLAGEHSALNTFATPRRLAAHVSHVLAVAPDRRVAHKLMPASVGLDGEGRPTPALLKRLAALGAGEADVPRLRREGDGKAATLHLDATLPGATLAAGLQVALDEAIAKLPIPKVMTYQLERGSGEGFQPGWTSVHFVRPAHGLVALHGADVVPVRVLGLEAGRRTRGHRFEAPMDPVMLQDADHYERQLLEQGAVIAGFAARRAEVARQLAAAAAREGLVPVDDEALLDEVTALVERPNVLACRFESEFLAVPQECLILTMKANQKYFPLLDTTGRLSDRFLVVSNIRPEDPRRVVEGNERVVRPRLADAKFFFDQDRRRTLASRVPGLAKVVYHGKLGTQGERVDRVRRLARTIGAQLGGPTLADLAEEAATLAKADLLTDMVGEFPELQGIMGAYYARHDGLRDAVADAIEDHYRPRFAGDALPRGAVGLAVALADKLETLAGLFGIGQLPTGDKDPFALRRHALGVIRMLVERDLPLDPVELIAAAFGVFPEGHGQAQAEVGFFVRERLVGWLREQGWSAQEVDAIVEARPVRWGEIPRRLAAVRAFCALPEAASLAAANKRVGNILRKSDAPPASAVDDALLAEPAERALSDAIAEAGPRADAAFAAGDYAGALSALALLKAPVDEFFDRVLVNADDPRVRANRLALLGRLHAAMNRVADLSRLAA